MKKAIYIIFVLFLTIVLIGCNTPEGPEVGGETETSDYERKFETIKTYIDENIPYIVTEDIELPEEFIEHNAILEWSSSNEDVITFYGGVAADKNKAVEVTLSYKVIIDSFEKEGSKNIIVSPITVDKVYERFEKQFSINITRDYTVKNTFFELFTVEWYSSDESIFDNNGKFYKPRTDKEFKINYVVKCGEFESLERSITLLAIGLSDLEKIDEIKNWIATEGLLDLYLTNEVSLPNYYEPFNVKITWESTNEDVVSSLV